MAPEDVHEDFVDTFTKEGDFINPEKCHVNDFGGKSHSYGLCVKEPQVKSDFQDEGDRLNINRMTKHAGEMFNYMDCLVSDDTKCLASTVRDRESTNKECAPISGNTYALKTNSKCTEVSGTGEKILSKYINNQSGCKNIITGRSGGDAGAMMKALTKAGCIVDSGLYTAFMGETKPKCKGVYAKCSISAPEGLSYKLHSTPLVYLEEEQANELIERKLAVAAPISDMKDTSGFANLYENVNNYYKNNPDIILNNNINNNINNLLLGHNINNKKNINDLFNSILLLFLLYILFKLLYKK